MSNNSTQIILAALAGAAVGVGIGMLLAPDSGANTRRKIKEHFGDTKENWSKRVDALLAGARESSGDLLQALDELIGDRDDKHQDEADELIALLEKKLELLKQPTKKS